MKTEIQPLTVVETKRFLEMIHGDGMEAFYSVALALGLRRGEALALRWEDVDLEAGIMHVRHHLHRPRGGGWKLAAPKSARGKRAIRMPRFAIEALGEHRKRQVEERLAAGSEWQDHGFIFTTATGLPVDGNNVYKRFKRLLAKAGFREGVRLHDLRHTAAKLLLAQGVHERSIMEILGHSQISLTMDTYSHVMPSLLDDAAGKMDQILGSGS